MLKVYLDFEKAFDTVSHRRLLNKLKAYNEIFKWVEDYLSDRTQVVVVNGTETDAGAVLNWGYHKERY